MEFQKYVTLKDFFKPKFHSILDSFDIGYYLYFNPELLRIFFNGNTENYKI